MTPRKHAEVIKAWADGAQIQFRNPGSHEWADIKDWSPRWADNVEYRVKPPKKELWVRPHLSHYINQVIVVQRPNKELFDNMTNFHWLGPAIKVWEESE